MRCSGLVTHELPSHREASPRDADQRRRTEQPSRKPSPGDLISYGDETADHIAFWLGDGRICIDAAGRTPNGGSRSRSRRSAAPAPAAGIQSLKPARVALTSFGRDRLETCTLPRWGVGVRLRATTAETQDREGGRNGIASRMEVGRAPDPSRLLRTGSRRLWRRKKEETERQRTHREATVGREEFSELPHRPYDTGGGGHRLSRHGSILHRAGLGDLWKSICLCSGYKAM